MAEKTSSGSIGFPAALGILFIGLKLAKVIDWSWWWVLSPFWIGIAAAVAFGVLVLVFYFFRAIYHRLTH